MEIGKELIIWNKVSFKCFLVLTYSGDLRSTDRRSTCMQVASWTLIFNRNRECKYLIVYRFCCCYIHSNDIAIEQMLNLNTLFGSSRASEASFYSENCIP